MFKSTTCQCASFAVLLPIDPLKNSSSNVQSNLTSFHNCVKFRFQRSVLSCSFSRLGRQQSRCPRRQNLSAADTATFQRDKISLERVTHSLGQMAKCSRSHFQTRKSHARKSVSRCFIFLQSAHRLSVRVAFRFTDDEWSVSNQINPNSERTIQQQKTFHV